MQTHSKHMRYASLLLSGFLIVFGSVSSVAYADTTSAKASPFCKVIDTTTTKTKANINARFLKAVNGRKDQDKQIASRRADWTQKVQEARKRIDDQLKENFTKLETKAKTDTQKTAIKDYEKAITEALAAKRAAHDLNTKNYIAAMDKLITNQRQQVDKSFAAFNTAAVSAMDQAKAGCAADPTNLDLRPEFLTAMQVARNDLANDLGQAYVNEVANNVQDLALARRDASQQADDVFNQALITARQALRSHFDKNAGV